MAVLVVARLYGVLCFARLWVLACGDRGREWAYLCAYAYAYARVCLYASVVGCGCRGVGSPFLADVLPTVVQAAVFPLGTLVVRCLV